MFDTLGILGFPLLLLAFVVIVMLQRGLPTVRFARAKAFSPATARRPASLGITFPEVLQSPVRKGVLIATGDGRYYVALAALNRMRRRHRRLIGIAAATLGALAIAAWMF